MILNGSFNSRNDVVENHKFKYQPQQKATIAWNEIDYHWPNRARDIFRTLKMPMIKTLIPKLSSSIVLDEL